MTDWQQNQLALQKHLKEEKLENFLRWSTIEKTMFVGDVDYVRKEFGELRDNFRYFPTAESFALIAETWVGNPKPFNDWTSGNLIHQLYHLKQWLDRSKVNVSQLSSIVEFGAGYGAMALICRRLGFEGWYHIIDLPELAKIQGYYLHNTGKGRKTLWQGKDCGTPPKQCDLFIGCHSLSEVDTDTREKLLSQVAAKEYLFASSYEFEGVDNQRWFQQLGGMIGRDWVFYPHPYQENCFYMVGVKA